MFKEINQTDILVEVVLIYGQLKAFSTLPVEKLHLDLFLTSQHQAEGMFLQLEAVFLTI